MALHYITSPQGGVVLNHKADLLADGVPLHLIKVGGDVADSVEELPPEHLAHQRDGGLGVPRPVLQDLQTINLARRSQGSNLAQQECGKWVKPSLPRWLAWPPTCV